MRTKHFLSITALAGALLTGSVAFADHDRRAPYTSNHDAYGYRGDDGYRDYDQRGYRHDHDVIGRERMSARRGTASFAITSNMRRDGLQLATNARALRVVSVELEYSDGFVERLNARQLREHGDGLLTIQTGRPPGLRHVRVHYTLGAYDRGATLELIQLHTGSGYTSDADIARAQRLREQAAERPDPRRRYRGRW